MTEERELLNEIGLRIPRVLFPGPEVNKEMWPVVACDQFTSQPEYWNDVESLVGVHPSTYRLILPESFLNNSDVNARISSIHENMHRYLREGILLPEHEAFYLIIRETEISPPRHGLIAAIDLEKYDYKRGSSPLIRSTEATILERIPPRKRIRENAALELPHVLVLFDDTERTVLEPLVATTPRLRMMYNVKLMKNGGNVTAFQVDDSDTINIICRAFKKILASKKKKSSSPFLFVVGDGNHSLAAAKSYWMDVKKNLPAEKTVDHPARFALVELLNIHDEGVRFEPIHRLACGIPDEEMFMQLKSEFRDDFSEYLSLSEVTALMAGKGKRKKIGVCSTNLFGIIDGCRFLHETIELLDNFLAKLSAGMDITLDYIHGEKNLMKLAAQADRTGFILQPLRKEDFFSELTHADVFPRKSFSMGEAEEKRYYFESRIIVP